MTTGSVARRGAMMGARLLLIAAALVLAACGADFEPADMPREDLRKPLVLDEAGDFVSREQNYAVAVRKDGSVWTWGTDSSGMLARSCPDRPACLRPGPVPGLSGIVSVATGLETALVLDSAGNVRVWGEPFGEKRKDRDAGGRPIPYEPVRVEGLPSIKQVAVGSSFNAAVAMDGTVWVWGGRDWRESIFGHDDFSNENSPPVQIEGLSGIRHVSSGGRTLAAIDGNGTLWTVGKQLPALPGAEGELVRSWRFPRKVVDVELGAFGMAVVLLENGEIWTWGRNDSGQLGHGDHKESLVPRRVEGVSRVVSIAAHIDSVAALTDSGDLLTWGALGFDSPFCWPASCQMELDRPVVIAHAIPSVRLVPRIIGGYLDHQGHAWFFGVNVHGSRGTGTRNESLDLDYLLAAEKSLWSR